MNCMQLVIIMEVWEEDTILLMPRIMDNGMTLTTLAFIKSKPQKWLVQLHICFFIKELIDCHRNSIVYFFFAYKTLMIINYYFIILAVLNVKHFYLWKSHERKNNGQYCKRQISSSKSNFTRVYQKKS